MGRDECLKFAFAFLIVAGLLLGCGCALLPFAEPLALRRTPFFAFRTLSLIVFAGFLALPVLAVLASWLPIGQGDAQAGAILREMAATVLPGYVWTTLWLSVLVALGAAIVGTGTAAAVTLFDFPGRRTFEWLLLLPLAMPAYVTAYAYTDFLQFSGPLQVGLRNTFGLEGRLLPEVRSLGGAVWVFIFSLYPYVYLLARTALGERAAHLMEAARLLGAPLSRRIRAVALPLARPAVAAGVALVLMETLADFGVASYFGIQTFTTGIYKAWLSMDNRLAAAQLATMLLVLVMALLHLEHRAQKRMRFATGGGACGVGRGAAVGPARRAALGRMGCVHCACGDGFCGARAFHAAPAGGRLVGVALGAFHGMGLAQRAPRWHHRRAGGGRCAGAGLRCAPPARCHHTRRGATGERWLCGARRRHRGGPAAARGLAAGGHAAVGRGLRWSLPRRLALCGPTWCAFVRWRCSRCKAAMRASHSAWMIPPACSASKAPG